MILPNFGAIVCGVGRKVIRTLGDKALSRPSARLAKSATRSSCDIIRDAFQDIRISLIAFALKHPACHLAHPERAFAAGSTLAATFMRIELVNIIKRPDHVP